MVTVNTVVESRTLRIFVRNCLWVLRTPLGKPVLQVISDTLDRTVYQKYRTYVPEVKNMVALSSGMMSTVSV